MSYAIRKDGQGWRAVNGSEDVGADEDFSESQPVPIEVSASYQRDEKITRIRSVREAILNRLAGIALAAQISGDAYTVAAFVTARAGLLDITTDLPQNPAEIDGVVLQRYGVIVAGCTPAMVSAFARVDA